MTTNIKEHVPTPIRTPVAGGESGGGGQVVAGRTRWLFSIGASVAVAAIVLVLATLNPAGQSKPDAQSNSPSPVKSSPRQSVMTSDSMHVPQNVGVSPSAESDPSSARVGVSGGSDGRGGDESRGVPQASGTVGIADETRLEPGQGNRRGNAEVGESERDDLVDTRSDIPDRRRLAFDDLRDMPDTVGKDLPVAAGSLDDRVVSAPIDLGAFDAVNLVAPSFTLAYPRDLLHGQEFRCDIVPDQRGWRIEVGERVIDGTSRVEIGSLVPREGRLYLEINSNNATPLQVAYLRRCVLLVKAVSPETPQGAAEVQRAIRLIRPLGGVLSMDVNPRVNTTEVLSFVGRVPAALGVSDEATAGVLPSVGCSVDGELEWVGFSPGKDGRRVRSLSFPPAAGGVATDTTTLVTLPVGNPAVAMESRLDLSEGSVSARAFLAGAAPEGLTVQELGQMAVNPQDRRKGLYGKVREAFKRARKEFNDADTKSVQRGIDELEGALSLLSIDPEPLVRSIREQEASHNRELRSLGNEVVPRLLVEWRKFVRDDIKPKLDVLEEAAITGAGLVGETVAPLANPVRLRILRIESEAVDGDQRYSVPLFVASGDDRPLPGDVDASGANEAKSGLD